MISIGSATAVEKHLDHLETIVYAFLVAILIVLVGAANSSAELQLLGTKIETKDAYGVVLALFDAFLFGFCSAIWKIGDFLAQCDGDEAEKAITTLLTHKWLLNPFAHSGSRPASIVNAAFGSALLVFLWWVGLAAIVLLAGVSDSTNGSIIRILRYLYALLGITGLLAIVRDHHIVLTRIRPGNRALVRSLVSGGFAKLLISMIAAGLGWALYYDFSHIGA